MLMQRFRFHKCWVSLAVNSTRFYLKIRLTLWQSSGPTPSPGISVTVWRPCDCVSGWLLDDDTDELFSALDLPRVTGKNWKSINIIGLRPLIVRTWLILFQGTRQVHTLASIKDDCLILTERWERHLYVENTGNSILMSMVGSWIGRQNVHFTHIRKKMEVWFQKSGMNVRKW